MDLKETIFYLVFSPSTVDVFENEVTGDLPRRGPTSGLEH